MSILLGREELSTLQEFYIRGKEIQRQAGMSFRNARRNLIKEPMYIYDLSDGDYSYFSLFEAYVEGNKLQLNEELIVQIPEVTLDALFELDDMQRRYIDYRIGMFLREYGCMKKLRRLQLATHLGISFSRVGDLLCMDEPVGGSSDFKFFLNVLLESESLG